MPTKRVVEASDASRKIRLSGRALYHPSKVERKIFLSAQRRFIKNTREEKQVETLTKYLAVAMGGALGACLRHYLGGSALLSRTAAPFPIWPRCSRRR